MHTSPALLRPLYPPGAIGRPTTGQDKDDEDDLEQELDEFDAEELFEDEDITNRPQRSEPEGALAQRNNQLGWLTLAFFHMYIQSARATLPS